MGGLNGEGGYQNTGQEEMNNKRVNIGTASFTVVYLGMCQPGLKTRWKFNANNW